MSKGIFLIFGWVLFIVACVYLFEFLSKRKVKINRKLHPVLLIQIDELPPELETMLSKIALQLRDITARGVHSNILVTTSLAGEEKERLKSACFYRNIVFVEEKENLLQYLNIPNIKTD